MTRKRKDSEEQRRRNQLLRVLSTPDGLAVVSRIVERCRVFNLSFHASSDRVTSFREGERNIGNWLIANVATVAPQLLPDILASGISGNEQAQQDDDRDDSADSDAPD